MTSDSITKQIEEKKKNLENYYKQYFIPKSDLDKCLVTDTREYLKYLGVSDSILQECYDKHYYITSSYNKTEDVQRFNLNRYWNIQLLSLDVDTLETRRAIVWDGSTQDWWELMQRIVLPYVVEQQLPVNLNHIT